MALDVGCIAVTVFPSKLAAPENNPLIYNPPWLSNSMSIAWSESVPPAVLIQIGFPKGSNFPKNISLEFPVMVVFLIVAEISKLPAMYLLPNWSTFTALMEAWYPDDEEVTVFKKENPWL